MANRHKAFAKGGAAKKKTDDAEEHEVEREAHLKRGGKAKHAKVHGGKGHHRLDKRARGGGVGADHHPFSSAHVKPLEPGGNPKVHHGGK
jgi:hypothetical protein